MRPRNLISLLLLPLAAATSAPPRVLVVGGTGRIGSAVAAHMLSQAPASITLAGRCAERGEVAVQEVLKEQTLSSEATLKFLQLDWRDDTALRAAMRGVDAIVHTAGPYADETPDVLRAALAERVPVYVDLSDPVEYLDECKAIGAQAAATSETLALCAAGAFPGLSNVLAMECIERLGADTRVKDVDFSYFTAGLGGSGDINLYITNDGFGCPVPIYKNGEYAPSMEAGGNQRQIKFFLSEDDPSARLVGERAVWSWPFPEGALIPRQLDGGIAGDTSVGMGTAPAIWNDVMGLMVDVVPREWWRRKGWSQGLASFSKPLVDFTDLFVGETHAMRVDVTSTCGKRVSAVQAHESFRRVVGQSCAEFTMALLASKGLMSRGAGDMAGEIALPAAGVFTPEGLFSSAEVRGPVLDRLLAIPGTLNAGYEEGRANL